MRVRMLFTTACTALLLTGAAWARSGAGLHWETLHVYHTEPTEIFAKLGLTHSTRYGHTLGQKHIPDPTFPPGLTDVVPYDPGHTLLVRGTTAGLAQFRARVESADVPDPQWQVSVTLLRNDPDGGSGQLLAGQAVTVRADHPTTVSFNAQDGAPRYEFTVHPNRDGTLSVTRRTSLALAPTATPDSDASAPDTLAPAAPASNTSTVFVPDAAWTPPIREDVRAGDMLSFSDLATDRAAARKALGQSDADDAGEDYTVQVQITDAPADVAPTEPAATP